MAWEPHIIDVEGILPDNYLPVALSYFNGLETRSRVLIEPNETDLGIVSAVTLANPKKMAEVTKSADTLIGPFAPAARDLTVKQLELPHGLLKPSTVVIVDIGIAFWDRSFSPIDSSPMFEAVISMDFNGDTVVTTSRSRVTNPDFFQTVESIYAAKGNQGVFAYLADEFPGSVYNPGFGRPRLGPSDFAHGTAMAALVAKDKPNTRLIAFELPAEAYLDRAGKSLRAILPAIMEQIHILTAQASGPIYVLLPYSYLRGPVPQDGGPVKRPALDALEADLALGEPKTMVLPVGNFLQEQLHARLEQSRAITWSIPTEDPSPNTLSFHWAATCDDPVTLTLLPPGGSGTATALSRNDLLRVIDGGDVVAAAILRQIDGWWRLDVSVGPTKRGFGTTPPGLYSISLDAGHRLSDLHVLVQRDDQPGLNSLVQSSPQSFLVDPNYKRRGPQGSYLLNDRDHLGSTIRREGTASHLVLGRRTNRQAVVATVQDPTAEGRYRRADYASLFQGEACEKGLQFIPVGSIVTPGVVVRSNGAGRFERIEGTSVAAALAVRAAV